MLMIIEIYLLTGALLLFFIKPYRQLIYKKAKESTCSIRQFDGLFVVGLASVMAVFWAISIPLLKKQAKQDIFNAHIKALEDQDKFVRDPDIGYRERQKGERYDPVEDGPQFQAVIDGVRAEAHKRLELHPWRNQRGYGNVYRKTIKFILREEYGIHWRTLDEMNPHIMYD